MSLSPENEETPVYILPESEAVLSAQATPLGESIVYLNSGGSLIYGIMQRSRAVTEQSDFFCFQFRGYATANGTHWQMFEDDDSHYHQVYNCAWVRVDKPSRSVTFGPKGGVSSSLAFMDTDLDTFLFARAINWARALYADFAVSPDMITLTKAATDDDRAKRSSFFTSQGFQFDWQDTAQNSALYFKDKVGKLFGVWTKERVDEMSAEALLQTLSKHGIITSDLEQRLHNAESAHAQLKHALQKERSTSQILTGVVVLGALLGLWLML